MHRPVVWRTTQEAVLLARAGDAAEWAFRGRSGRAHKSPYGPGQSPKARAAFRDMRTLSMVCRRDGCDALVDYKQFVARDTFGLCNYENSFEMSCAPGAYTSFATCVACPANAVCLGGYSEPFAELGFWKTPVTAGADGQAVDANAQGELEWTYVQVSSVALPSFV